MNPRSFWKVVLVALVGCDSLSLATASNPSVPEQDNRRFTSETCTNRNDNEQDGACRSASPAVDYTVARDCAVVMAHSKLSGWGIFSLVDRPKGKPLIFGDSVIQVPDLQPLEATHYWIREYFWEATATGGHFEGKQVSSLVPGVGMLANGAPSSNDNDPKAKKGVGISNVLPFRPVYDDGNVRRNQAGAGAFSHYFNYTFYVHRAIRAGQEVLVQYEDGYFMERQLDNMHATQETYERPVGELRSQSICLDSLRPGPSKVNENAGRGAFATRFIRRHSVVAPVPVLPIFDKFKALVTTKLRNSSKHDDGTVVEVVSKQLLWNYCFGHPKSSLLLFPYSPVVNFVNHANANDGVANVRLQWSSHPTLFRDREKWLSSTLDELSKRNESGLLLELVATRDIRPGEEILLDYGIDWQTAWEEHVDRWQPPEESDSYTPAVVMDEVAGSVRTTDEQISFPYPDNVFTACFYEYDPTKFIDGKATSKTRVRSDTWNFTRSVFDWKNLRPCSIVKRDSLPTKTYLYTVQMRNRYGLKKEERIPKGTVHLVSRVPRQSIRFMDKLYTTDQHLEGAFRHEIGIRDDIFPSQWKDLP
uniref:SET domain-containing protein n=1 Tax=Grammatophora oceanica TaxID=210454 RepID=A0A7S1Y7F5_9STRA|mmetsp:Transcript_28585/g.42104  ORF Transcript_28585/g.42104 Transcript_28585/m.42104 type:complete len:589 (+) Transcript_28585:119-1885(+)